MKWESIKLKNVIIVSIATYLCIIVSIKLLTKPSEESNKELVRYFIEEMLAKGDLTEYKERRTDDFVCHAPDGDYKLEEDYKNALEVQKVMKGFQVSIIKIMAEHDMVAVHWQAESSAEVGSGITWFRVQEGKLAEEWPSLPYFRKK